MKKVLSILLCVCLLGCLVASPVSYAAERAEKNAVSVRLLSFDLRSLLADLLRMMAQRTGQTVDNGQTEQNDGETTETEVITEPQDAVAAYEKRVWELVNAERAKAGLPALTYSTVLADGAREKSADMQRNRYFSHESPTYGSPFDMMRSFGITYRAAGENIAMGYRTPEAVMNGWMNSEGHRANILSEKFTEIGVGYVEEGNYWTQWFRG